MVSVGSVCMLLCIAPIVRADGAVYTRMRVDDVVHETREIIPGTDTYRTVQTLSATVVEGERKGETMEIDNDRIILDEGDVFFAKIIASGEDVSVFVYDAERLPIMTLLLVVFIALTLFFGGRKSARSLVSLGFSIAVIAFVLLPLLAAGYPPIPVSVVLASLILFVAIFFTHGWNKGSAVAFGGTVCSVMLTGVIAAFVLHAGMFTGLSSDESVSVMLGSNVSVDFAGILLASVLIGALGVLDDVGITQVSVVKELCAVSGGTRREIYKSAMNVGKDHVGALINTLALAYTASGLPLLLLFTVSHEVPVALLINGEAIAEEILRALAGSIGLIVAIPATTYVAVRVFYRG